MDKMYKKQILCDSTYMKVSEVKWIETESRMVEGKMIVPQGTGGKGK